MIEIFEPSLPSIVTAGFAGTYVLMISVFNMVGRIFWASMSILLEKNSIFLFFSRNLLYLSIPFTAKAMSVDPVVTYLILFYAASMIIFTMYGGGFATIPAYLADIFGTKYVEVLRTTSNCMVNSWSFRTSCNYPVKTKFSDNAITDLVSKISPEKFSEIYGDSIENLSLLVQQKTVTISNLMPHMPEGTINPSTTLYNSTMFAMAALLGIAFISNLLIGPVNEKHHMKE